jgi:primosomal protein N' (replication factor Y)
MLYTVLTASKSPGIGSGLTYESAQPLTEGAHVLVPLRQKLVEGIVIAVEEQRKQEDFDVKKVKTLLNDQALLSPAHIKTLRWMAQYYCCSLRQALNVWLPSPPWQALTPQPQTGYRLLKNEDLRGTKQRAIVEYLTGRGWISAQELRQNTSANLQTLQTLVKRAVIAQEEHSDEKESVLPITREEITYPTLTPAQKEVADSIAKDERPALLFGITSSGKTEVYAQLIADTLLAGKQAILLVPEILLTEHCIYRFQNLLNPERIAILHSRLTPNQRRVTWRKIRRGEIALVIGSRSALFAPLQKLGLVILDEEHEWTYKNEQTPRYHARETAEALCRFSGAKLVLGTATPSLESWSRAKSGTYNLVRLPDRYQNHALPTVRVIDLATVDFGTLYPFSPPLLEAITKRLKCGDQSVLFLNHRGVASALLCLDCRRRVTSPESHLPFTVHRSLQGNPILRDHITGIERPVPSACPACGSVRLRAVGAGTQRIEELLQRIFPEARLLRADSDVLTHPEHMRLLLKKMRERQADILLGTQSVVKGLDLPDVTLAAVLIADIGLSLPHFRAGERIFQLLTQLTGRSGRAQPGEVIIQTFRPDAPEVRLAAEHKTEQFLEDELRIRLHTGYPPATQMIRLIVRENAATRAPALRDRALRAAQEQNISITAHCAPLLFGGNRAWHVLLKGANPREVLAALDLNGIVVDVDPTECV